MEATTSIKVDTTAEARMTHTQRLRGEKVYTPLRLKPDRPNTREKIPYGKGWQDKPKPLDSLPRGENVGLLLEHAGLTDIDLDSPAARTVAASFMPTTLAFGRGGETSHLLYQGAADNKTLKDANGDVILEVRHRGKQVMAPDSVHPDTGEEIEWMRDREPVPVPSQRDLLLFGTAILMEHHLPQGGRHDLALAYAGFLLKHLSEDEVGRIFGAVSWDAVNATEALRDTARRMDQGENVTGGGYLQENVPSVVGLLQKWWGWRDARSSDVPTHDELRDRYIEANPDVGYGMGEYRRYRGGIWVPEDELSVERGVTGVLEAAKEEGIRPTHNLVGSVAGMVKVKIAVPDWVWDRDTGLLVTENGALDLSSRKLLPHSRSHHATQKLPYAYDPEAWPPIFDNFIRATLPDSWEFVQEFFGYCLTPDCDHEIALWLYGVRGSGKSTLMEGLMAMLGHRYGKLGLSNIQNGRFGLANLPGKYVLGATEQPASYLAATDILDAIISGEEVDIERKFKDVVTVRSTAKVVWAMNDLPRIGNTTSGTFRRVKVIEFPEPTRRDPRVKERIKGEGAGILNWSLVGLDRLKRRGHFDIPESVASATEDFQKDNDIPKLFVEDHCIRKEGETVQASVLYDRYAAWCKRHGHKPQSATRVAHDWKRLGIKKHVGKIRGKVYYDDIKVPELVDTDSWGR